MNVRTLIDRAVREYPERTALVMGDRRLDFSGFNLRVNRLANGLSELGIKKGDRVGILMKNCCEFVEIDFALSKAGVVRVPLNARLLERDHIYMLNDSGASALIYGKDFSGTVAAMLPELAAVELLICAADDDPPEPINGCHFYEDLIERSSPDDPPAEITEKDLHTLFYTSGTTGKPKGVMLSQKSWANVAINLLLDYGPFTRADVLLNTQPLSHGAGFFVLPFFMRGATNVLIPGFNPELVFKTIEREKVTVLKLVPAMIYQLLDSPDKKKYDLTSLDSIIYGGSPIVVPRLIDAIHVFGKKFVQLYGQAEAPMCITTLAKEDHVTQGRDEEVKRLSSAGKACANVEVKVVDEKGKEVQPEEIGEVIVRGYHMMDGYWNRPKETAEALRDGWIFSGDLGYTDARGFVFLVDRKKDMIISGAFNIYPKEVEDVIVAHAKVNDAAVIGVPDEKWGEAVKAIVVPKKDEIITQEDIIEHCRRHLARMKCPKSVDFIDELPRNPYGKVLKTDLRDPYWRGLERKIH